MAQQETAPLRFVDPGQRLLRLADVRFPAQFLIRQATFLSLQHVSRERLVAQSGPPARSQKISGHVRGHSDQPRSEDSGGDPLPVQPEEDLLRRVLRQGAVSRQRTGVAIDELVVLSKRLLQTEVSLVSSAHGGFVFQLRQRDVPVLHLWLSVNTTTRHFVAVCCGFDALTRLASLDTGTASGGGWGRRPRDPVRETARSASPRSPLAVVPAE